MVLVTVEPSDAPYPGHRGLRVLAGELRFLLGLLLELGVTRLVPDVVGLVVDDEQATAPTEALNSNRSPSWRCSVVIDSTADTSSLWRKSWW
jgi:hypothetical protein